MNISVIVWHGLISVLGWGVGLMLGSLLGYGLALGIKKFFSARGNIPKSLILIPWRTLWMAAILFAGFPILIVNHFGLGSKSGVISVASAFMITSMVYWVETLLADRFPKPLLLRLFSGVRTLATASVVFLAFAGTIGANGIGFVAMQHLQLLEYELVIQYFLVLLGLIFVLDEFLGVVQFVVSQLAIKSGSSGFSVKIW